MIDREIEFAAAGVAHLALLDRGEPGGAQKSVDRLRRRADARAASLLAAVRLARGNAVGDHRQPARCHIAAHIRGRDFRRRQLVADKRRQIGDRAALHARRNFLRQQFEQQFAHPCRLILNRHARPCAGHPRLIAAPRGWPGQARPLRVLLFRYAAANIVTLSRSPPAKSRSRRGPGPAPGRYRRRAR